MDAQQTINEVVEGVKSEGLFDQFRKECLEEFENMETYHQLKQRVQNHVTSFLSRHRYDDGLQKNTLRSNLRQYISKSEVLLNSITQLVDEVLSLKGKSFCLRIDKQVDKHLSKNIPKPQAVHNNNSQNTGESNSVSSHSGVPTDISNNNNSENSNNSNNNDIVEEQKEVLTNGTVSTVTDFNEMEIEEVEMEISENHEVKETCDDEINNEKALNDRVASNECSATNSNNVIIKTQHVDNNVKPVVKTNDKVQETKVKSEPENTFQPIVVKTEDGDVIKEELDAQESSESDSNTSEDVSHDDNDGDDDDDKHGLNLPPIITEPISDDSNSNDSTFANNIRQQMEKYRTSPDEPVKKEEVSIGRRNPSRVRTLPMKFRELDDVKKDDAESVSSSEIDYKDLIRGRSKKRPQSAGNPETAKNTKDRPSSISRVSTEKEKSSRKTISKQEEEAINFLTKPSVRKSMKGEGNESLPDSEEGNVSDEDEGIKYSRSKSCEAIEKKVTEKCEKDSNFGDRSGGKDEVRNKDKKSIKSEFCEKSYTSKQKKDFKVSSSGKDEDRKDRKALGSGRDDDRKERKEKEKKCDIDRKDRRSPGSGKEYEKKERKSSGSGHDDDRRERKLSESEKDDIRKDRKLFALQKDVDRKPSKSSSSRKDDDRRSRKSPSSGKDDDRKERKSSKDDGKKDRKPSGLVKDEDKNDRKSPTTVKDDDRLIGKVKDILSEHIKREYLSDSGSGSTSSSIKDDLDRKSHPERDDDVTREGGDAHRTALTRKRSHSPIGSPEGTQSKRSRRSIKQRQRYSPP